MHESISVGSMSSQANSNAWCIQKKCSNAAGYIKKEGKLYLTNHQQVRLKTQECQVPQGTLWVWLLLDPRNSNVMKCLTSARGGRMGTTEIN